MTAILIAFAPPDPPPRGRGFSTAGGRELGLESSPPCSFYLAINDPKTYQRHETEM